MHEPRPRCGSEETIRSVLCLFLVFQPVNQTGSTILTDIGVKSLNKTPHVCYVYGVTFTVLRLQRYVYSVTFTALRLRRYVYGVTFRTLRLWRYV